MLLRTLYFYKKYDTKRGISDTQPPSPFLVGCFRLRGAGALKGSDLAPRIPVTTRMAHL